MDAKTRNFLAQRREPAIWFRSVEQAVSKNRWGGRPSLPDGVDWPVHPDTMRPLHFMAQVDLSSLPPTPMQGCPFKAELPPSGMLFFFFDFARYWDDEDDIGAPKHSRVVYAADAGSDREVPAALPGIGYDPQNASGDNGSGETLLPMAHLQAHEIDTFWTPAFFVEGGRYFRHFESGPNLELAADAEATWQSILKATGEAAPIVTSDNDPSPPLGYYLYRRYRSSDLKKYDDEKCITKFQMFGPETQFGVGSGEPPRETSNILLLELPIDAHEFGSLQYWMTTKDFRARRFERACGNAHFT